MILVFGPVIDEFQGWFGWPSFAATNPDLQGFWFLAVWFLCTALFAVVLRVAGDRLLHAPTRHRPTKRG